MPAQPSSPPPVRVPAHLWLVGLLLLLLNCWGLFAAIASQVRLYPDMSEGAIAQVASQPAWFMLVGDLSPLAGVAGSLALLVQSRWAPRLFVFQIAVLVLGNGYEVLRGASPLLTVPEVRVSMAFLLVLLAAQTLYAHRMARRGLLS